MTAGEGIQDQWARWLLERRFGGQDDRRKMLEERLYPVRNRVLGNAKVAEGDRVLDVGAGDGLIAFGALPLVGEQGKVIFSDISQDLLDHSQALAEQMGVLDRLEFLHASADDLSALSDASVDVVTTRSVLIYVVDQQKALQEFYRVLVRGGRLAIHEPINRFAHPEPAHVFMGYDVGPIQTIADKLRALYDRLQPAESDPMLNFDERDLLALTEQAGFEEIHLELRADVEPAEVSRWETVWQTAGNPKIPTLEEAATRVLTPAEVEQFVAYLRPRVEAGQGVHRLAVADLWAVKQP